MITTIAPTYYSTILTPYFLTTFGNYNLDSEDTQ